jgi:high-affinity iron transporter
VLRLSLILIAALLLPCSALSTATDRSPTRDELAAVRASLEGVEQALAAERLRDAADRVRQAYLAFEAIEADVAAADHELAESIEEAFAHLMTRAAAGDAAGARAALEEVRALLDRVAGASEPLGSRAAFLHSFGILFREGIEALLLCTALAAACAKRGGGRLTRAIGYGALAAIGASLATAVLAERVLRLAPAGREAIEGVTMLLAALVLFYVSYWLLSKVEAARWMGYLRDRIGRAENRWALAGVAFLAVYREGVETILFYQALAATAAGAPVLAGFVAASLSLLLVAVAVLRFGVRLPMRPLFAATGALLYYLAVVFAGQGVHELQEAGWIGLTPVEGVPEIGWLGLYPTVETLAAQGALVALALTAAVVLARRRRDARLAAREVLERPARETAATG